MSGSKKNRRSNRVPVSDKLILTITGDGDSELLKEIITTLEISKNGARIRGRRTLHPDWKGAFVQLSSGRRAPVRIVWQRKPSPGAEYLESGVEILSDYDFWGRTFTTGDMDEEPAVVIENSPLSPEQLLQLFSEAAGVKAEQSAKLLEVFWCGLVEQLEERKVITREELAASIRKIAGELERK